MMMIGKQQEALPYFNSGMLIVPAELISALEALWRKAIFQLLDIAGDWEKEEIWCTDQLALTVALCNPQLKFRELPYRMNWLLNDVIPDHLLPEFTPPLIMHSIHQMDFEKETLLPTRHTLTQEAIDKYNRLVENN